MTKVAWAAVGAVAVLFLWGIALFFGVVGNPAIARMRGEVRSVQNADDRTEICLSRAVDDGSTYGDGELADLECWSGTPQGRVPGLGDCVALEIQGESSQLAIGPATGCQ